MNTRPFPIPSSEARWEKLVFSPDLLGFNDISRALESALVPAEQ